MPWQWSGTARSYATEAALVQEEPIVVARIRTTRKNADIEGNATETLASASRAPPKTRAPRTKKAAAVEDGTNAATTKLIGKTAAKVQAASPKLRKKKTAEVDESATTANVKKTTRRSKIKTPVQNLTTSSATAPAEKTQLRPYQQECIDACLTNLSNGIKRQIVSLPVGSGKTVIFSHLMKKVPEPFPGATKTLILAHRQELLEQTKAHVLRTGTGLSVTVDQGKRIADMSADVIVASVPSLGRVGAPRLAKYDPSQFKCIIIDEAHHAAADSYMRILKHFKADVKDTHIFVYGCSATVRRHDGLRLGGAFDYISFHKSFITMIEDKWLCGLQVSTIQTDFDLRDVKMQGGDFAQKDLSIKVNTPLRNEIIVRSFMTYCKSRKSTVVFAVDIEHLETLTELFRQHGFDARGLSSKTDDVERAQMLKDFRERKFPVIVNCGILTEGTDIPAIDSIIMARPTKSNVLFQQMLGRGMRLYDGKENCLVLDFVDVVKGEGLVNLPTLLGLDTESLLNKTAVINNQQDVDTIREEEIAALEQDQTPNTITQFPDETETVTAVDPMTGLKVARIRVLEYENPYQLLGDCSGIPRRVWEMSPNSWVNVGPDAFVLTFNDITFRIDRSEDGIFRCRKRVNIKQKIAEASVSSFQNGVLRFKNNYAAAATERKRQKEEEGGETMSYIKSKGVPLPIESDTLEDCLHGVDTWIAQNIGHFPELLGRYAKWRSFPASDSQLRFLRKLGYDQDEPEEGEDQALQQQRRRGSARRLTKGQAANMITRLVNGAGKRWEEGKKFKIKRAKELAKEIGVDVGPIPKFVEV
ncbi:hypothetical protein BGZ99_008305 [Dissophora globulifera]|uniref:P-loop containing nucleoside triphosphate hydrolase protein n=1 Tax=Dissophora globulifera TaxID=979702 RepID=A0A9P6R7M5_9FUNG|nr:hypothetical protein BGZ99_008305 [Dissophora globulifera]